MLALLDNVAAPLGCTLLQCSVELVHTPMCLVCAEQQTVLLFVLLIDIAVHCFYSIIYSFCQCSASSRNSWKIFLALMAMVCIGDCCKSKQLLWVQQSMLTLFYRIALSAIPMLTLVHCSAAPAECLNVNVMEQFNTPCNTGIEAYQRRNKFH